MSPAESELVASCGYLNVSAASNFSESLLALERLVHLVVRHAEHAELCIVVVTTLRKHHKVGHERHHDCFGIQLDRHGNRIARRRAIDQPETTHVSIITAILTTG